MNSFKKLRSTFAAALAASLLIALITACGATPAAQTDATAVLPADSEVPVSTATVPPSFSPIPPTPSGIPVIDLCSPDGFWVDVPVWTSGSFLDGTIWNPVSGEIVQPPVGIPVAQIVRNELPGGLFTTFLTSDIVVRLLVDGSCVYVSPDGTEVIFDDATTAYKLEGRTVIVSEYYQYSPVLCLAAGKTEQGFTVVYGMDESDFSGSPDGVSASEAELKERGTYIFVADFDVSNKSIKWAEPVKTADFSVIDELVAGGKHLRDATIADGLLYFPADISPGYIDLQTGNVTYLTEISKFADSIAEGGIRLSSSSVGPDFEYYYGFYGNVLIYGHYIIANGREYLLQYAVCGNSLVAVRQIGDDEVTTFSGDGRLLHRYGAEDFN
jgi:hypothetical protein